MGVAYYLLREDAHEVYDLGKAYGWGEALVRAAGMPGAASRPTPPLTLMVNNADRLIDELDALWHERDAYHDEPCPTEYHALVARDIIDWSAGRPVVYVSEYDGRIDDWDSEYHRPEIDEGGWRPLNITGSRFSGEMEKFAAERGAR